MQTDIIAGKHLGKKSVGSQNYNPSLLVAVPREENRKQYNIENLPFYGWDIWHAYEFSALTKNGIPVTRLLKIKYNCENKYIVESKSLKLYLNSFNMERFGKNIDECLKICKKIIENDLSKKLQTDVVLNFIDNDKEIVKIYSDFENIIKFIDEENINIDLFVESPNVLQTEKNDIKKEYRLHFDSLRSNCRVTHQPDFGDVFIYYESEKHIKEDSLVKYLSSFRSEYHFHEECCEMIFKRLYDILDKDDKLFVSALYTRRGGIDICPSRWSKNFNPKFVESLIDVTQLAKNGIKQ